jgi:predicted transcriptional regulator
MEALDIGVMSPERIRERFQAMIKGAYKPDPGEPKIWFASMQSLAEMLSDENRELLRVIVDTKPDSISALAQTTGQKPAELTRILKKMSNCGIVELKRGRNHVRPVARAIQFRIVLS